jgi:glycosyltransferase involved in cell wall biosynthesis
MKTEPNAATRLILDEGEGESLSIVVPAKDEEESLPILVQAIVDACAGGGLTLNDIVLVDDGSTDGTWTVMTRLAETWPMVRAIRLRRNFGKATALSAGIESATGTIIITMDADLQDDPKEIPRFVEQVRAGNDVVSGWKEKRNDPVSKTLPSRFFNWVTARASGVPLHDFNCGFKAYRREVFETVELYGELHRYVPVLAHALGYRVAELPVLHHARRFGHTKYGVARFLRGFLDLLTVMMITRYAYRPGHLFGGVGTAFLLLGGAVLAYLTALKIVTGATIGDRPLLLFGVMVVIIGIQLLLFGLLAELVISRTRSHVETGDLVRSRAGGSR